MPRRPTPRMRHIGQWLPVGMQTGKHHRQSGQILRQRARYEAMNNPWLQGMIQTKAFDIIGTGPSLQVLSDKPKLNKTIEHDFIEWGKRIHLAEKLHTMRMAQSRDGEAFAILFYPQRGITDTVQTRPATD